MDKKLVEWSQPEGSGHRLNVQKDISDQGCPSGVHTGTSVI